MSTAPGDGRGRGGRLDDAIAARGRADLVSGLRGLTRRPGAVPRRDPVTGAGSGNPGNPRTLDGPQPGGSGAGPEAEAEEHCELCGSALPPDHRHLLHLDERRMLCACETCWSMRSGEAAYRPAGVRTVWLEEFNLPDEAWAAFGVPIGLAFFMRTGSDDGVFAFYPSPAGATESEIDAGAWQKLADLNPRLRDLEPDCEALIVNRISEPHQHVIAPIDECYRLVGMIKEGWEGISGGAGTEQAIGRFFVELRIRGATMARSDG